MQLTLTATLFLLSFRLGELNPQCLATAFYGLLVQLYCFKKSVDQAVSQIFGSVCQDCLKAKLGGLWAKSGFGPEGPQHLVANREGNPLLIKLNGKEQKDTLKTV